MTEHETEHSGAVAIGETEAIAQAVGWETDAEREMELRVFHWNREWPEEDTRKLINDLWCQYVLAAEPIRHEPVAEWKLVPIEPTQEMIDAGRMARWNIQGGYGGPGPWEAMLAAAPSPPRQEPVDPTPVSNSLVLGWHVVGGDGWSDITDRQDIADQWEADGLRVTPLVATTEGK